MPRSGAARPRPPPPQPAASRPPPPGKSTAPRPRQKRALERLPSLLARPLAAAEARVAAMQSAAIADDVIVPRSDQTASGSPPPDALNLPGLGEEEP